MGVAAASMAEWPPLSRVAVLATAAANASAATALVSLGQRRHGWWAAGVGVDGAAVSVVDTVSPRGGFLRIISRRGTPAAGVSVPW